MGEQLTEVHINIIYRIPEKKIGKVYFIKVPSSIRNIFSKQKNRNIIHVLDLKKKKEKTFTI